MHPFHQHDSSKIVLAAQFRVGGWVGGRMGQKCHSCISSYGFRIHQTDSQLRATSPTPCAIGLGASEAFLLSVISEVPLVVCVCCELCSAASCGT